MSVEQYIAINDWMRSNVTRIEDTQCTQGEVASLATTALGYAVPLSSIQKCAKIIGIKWAKSPPKPPPVPIEREAIVILIAAVAGLYIETGKTVPDALANLKSAFAREDK